MRSQAANPDELWSIKFKFHQFRDTPLPNFEQAFQSAPGYVAGSFRLDMPERTVSFQYRGPKDAAHKYWLLAPRKHGVGLSVTPVSHERVNEDGTPATDESAATAAVATGEIP